MRFVPWLLTPLLLLGCRTPRAQTESLPAREITLDTSVPIAAPESLAARQAVVQRCFTRTRALSRQVIALQRARAMPGTLVGLGAVAVATVGIMRNDRSLTWGGAAAGWLTLGLIRLDRALNPQLRAARQRAGAGEAMWIEVRRQLNRWESAAREWNASRDGPSLASWQAEDSALRRVAEECLHAGS